MKKIKITGINARFVHSCLALFYIRNELEKKCQNCQSEIYQFTINDNYYEMLLRLSDEAPEYIFFSAAIWNSTLVERLTIDLHACLPDCRIVIGGPQAGVLAERLDPGYCTIVTGEIEAVGPEFFSDLENKSLAPRYHGAFFKDSASQYGFPYKKGDFDNLLKNKHIYYESSRGCPFSCSYCLSAAEKGLYHKDLDVVERELLEILQHRPKVLRFIDRTFNDLPERALAIWKFLDAHGGETLFHFEIAPDRFTKEMFTFLEDIQPGRFQFELGIQSTHEKTLDAVNRKVAPEDARRTVTRLVAMNNIHLHVDLILGLPFETRESFANSFRDVFAMGAHYIQMGLLKILPDTPISRSAIEYGYVHCEQPPYSVLKTAWMDQSMLAELYWFSECVEKFLNNRYFVSFWAYLRQGEGDMFFFFQRVLAVCRKNSFFRLAATQELMTKMLIEVIDDRDDKELIAEILRFDWLRCGFRFLPDILRVPAGSATSVEIRSALYQSLPAEYEGVYHKGNRNQFFRKSFFLRFSKQTLEVLGLESSSETPCLCFLPEKEKVLFGFNKCLVL